MPDAFILPYVRARGDLWCLCSPHNTVAAVTRHLGASMVAMSRAVWRSVGGHSLCASAPRIRPTCRSISVPRFLWYVGREC